MSQFNVSDDSRHWLPSLGLAATVLVSDADIASAIVIDLPPVAANHEPRSLWGVGSTAPYLHDGRATTLTEAILEHGGEAATSKTAFERLSTQDQADVIAYLDNLVLFRLPED